LASRLPVFVQGLVRDFINPLIAALFGKPDFSKFHFTVHHAVFATGISSTGCSQCLPPIFR
jgi:large-conductance mechanosensitive channel